MNGLSTDHQQLTRSPAERQPMQLSELSDLFVTGLIQIHLDVSAVADALLTASNGHQSDGVELLRHVTQDVNPIAEP